jgi:uncharacterized damage-inducible protein DinB
MRYEFLVDTYESERLKVLSVWSMFEDSDLGFRPHPSDDRGRSVHEQMIHQCVSEDLWFRNMLGIDVGAPPLPDREQRLGFIERYSADSGRRLEVLRTRSDAWWEAEVAFFDVQRGRTWVMVRRIAHTAHHRGQQMAMLRMLGRSLHSSYGPTADTGGLPTNRAAVVYAYPSVETLLEAEARGGSKAPLPGRGELPPTERP